MNGAHHHRTESGVTMDVEEFLSRGETPAGKWTTMGRWRSDGEVLVGLFDGGDPRQALRLLAYGLERLHGRQLWLGLPPGAVQATRCRAAFLDAEVRVLEHIEGRLEATDPASQDESLAWFGDLGGVQATSASEELDDAPEWLIDLIDWLESRRVELIRRSQYWSWQCAVARRHQRPL